MKEIKTKIIQGDCKDVLKTIDDDSIDLIVTSPPYAVVVNKFTLEFAQRFCIDGKIDWGKLLEFNSGTRKKHKAGKGDGSK